MTASIHKQGRGRPKLDRKEKITLRASAEKASLFREQAAKKNVKMTDHFEGLVDEHAAKAREVGAC